MQTYIIPEKPIGFGWEKAKKNIVFYAIALVAVMIVNGVVNGILNNPSVKESAIAVIILTVLLILIGTIINLGLIRIALNFIDKIDYKGRFEDFFSDSGKLLNYFIGNFLYAIIVFLGFILLIVPGIYFAIRFQFYQYLILDKGMKPLEAFAMSSKMTDGNKMELFLIGLKLVGINILGALCLLVGLFATIPTSMLASAHIYREMVKRTENAVFPNVL